MKRDSEAEASEELLPEYEFRRGARGKYRARYLEGSNVVLLEPDVARAFPTAGVINQALRALLEDGDSGNSDQRR